MKKYKNIPLVLLILDGWGIAPEAPGNAITQAKTPNMDKYIATFPSMTLSAAGKYVGLADGDKGNSEIGHLNIGLGRLSSSFLMRINKSIKTGDFFDNQAFLNAIEHAKKNKSKLHLIGLLSDGSVHSHINHLFALLDLVKKYKLNEIYIHVILDGWDTPRNKGLEFIEQLNKKIRDEKIKAKIATISGRGYAMDRIGDWQRTAKAFEAMVSGQSEEYYKDPAEAVSDSYSKEIFDDKIKPTVIIKNKKPVALIKDKDAVIFFNFRADRMKQLVRSFVLPDFSKFESSNDFNNSYFTSMTQYEKDLPVDMVAFASVEYEKSLAEILSQNNLRQLHITETEKYAHITYYFNGKKNVPFENEDWVLVPSLKTHNYEKKPEMSASKITDKILKFVTENKYDFIVANYPNPDVVAHTGNLKATVKACEIVDKNLHKIVQVVLSKGGMVMLTADHGNAEELQDIKTGEMNTSHSNNPVPLILVSKEFEGKNIGLPDVFGSDLSLLKPVGSLSDIAPTVLNLLNIDKPDEMTGNSLV
jgi:2,3-bisphosphoglycerate-independent phosphoglycerate mutase